MKKRIVKWLAFMLALVFIASLTPEWRAEAATAGWKKQTTKVFASDGNVNYVFSGWKYQLANGRYVNNCLCKIDGKYYLFQKNGKLQTGATSSLGGCIYEGMWMSTGTASKRNKDEGALSIGSVGGWKMDKTGYWFQKGKWYPKRTTIFINDNAYRFNLKGYLVDSKGNIVKPGTYKIVKRRASHAMYEVVNGKIRNAGSTKAYSYTTLKK
ncbi:MAG: hypothetical protein IJM27_03670 [Eubacterium sp.]|nr:hypothetical protein [Eubacterium sp.]